LPDRTFWTPITGNSTTAAAKWIQARSACWTARQPETGQIWIYVSKPEAVDPPDADYPIVQSYVDIFITGCLQLAERVVGQNEDFAEQCITTTSGWSPHWVNDRLLPRRPFIHQPNASEIDRLLFENVPDEVRMIRIE
jgi:hypothetical protein